MRCRAECVHSDQQDIKQSVRASQRRMNSSRWYLSRRATKIAAGCRPDTLRERLVNALGRRYRKQTCPTQAPSTQEAGAFLLNRGRGGLGKGGHKHSLHLPRRHGAAEAAEAAAPEATQAATAAPRRVAHAPSRAFQARPSSPICPSAYASHRLHRALPPDQSRNAAVRRRVAA